MTTVDVLVLIAIAVGTTELVTSAMKLRGADAAAASFVIAFAASLLYYAVKATWRRRHR